jgi:hypothetical protein
MDTPSRRACFESLRTANSFQRQQPAERLNSLLDRRARPAAEGVPCSATRKLRELDDLRSKAQMALPDKARPFDSLTSAVASRVWIARAR